MITEDGICEFLKGVLEEIKPLIPPGRHNWQKAKIERTASRSSFAQSTGPNFSVSFLFQKQDHFISLEKFTKSLEGDIHFQRLRDRSLEHFKGALSHWIQPMVLATYLVQDYLKMVEKIEFLDSAARPIAREFVKSLQSGITIVVCSSVIQGLELAFENQDLREGLRLRKLHDEEAVQHFLNYDDGFGHFLMTHKPMIAEIRFEFSSAGFPPSDIGSRVSSKFNNLVTAMRLIKPGRIELSGIWERREHLGQLAYLESKQGHRMDGKFFLAPLYRLDEVDVAKLSKYFTFIEKGVPNDRLQNAINRLEFASTRERMADQVLDLFIALETLFGDESGAIGYKIGMRCAKFVEKDHKARKELNETISNFFKKRHDIVHGGTKATKELTPDKVKRLFEIVQKATGAFIDQFLSGGKMPEAKDFDSLLLE